MAILLAHKACQLRSRTKTADRDMLEAGSTQETREGSRSNKEADSSQVCRREVYDQDIRDSCSSLHVSPELIHDTLRQGRVQGVTHIFQSQAATMRRKHWIDTGIPTGDCWSQAKMKMTQ